MSHVHTDQLLQMETTCGSLLCELKIIWDEVGEEDAERDKMLFELEQECVEVYRRKVDQANRSRVQLRQAIADSEAELAAICSAMGERPVHLREPDQNAASLKEELLAIVPHLEDMRKRKRERWNQFLEILEHIKKIRSEIFSPAEYTPSKMVVDENDLSIRKLEELHKQLEGLQQEKSDRLNQVLDHLNTLNSLCLVLGTDFKHTVDEVHPSLDGSEGSKNLSNETIQGLAMAIQKLLEIKIQRMQKLQDLATTMLEIWNLMDTPFEEQQRFQHVTCNIAASESEITDPNTLSKEFINFVEAEVIRLEELKASKMKELVLKKRSELEEICRRTHMVLEADSAMESAIEVIESGAVDASYILEQIENQIAKVKEEALCRKEIFERVEKWLAACEEESWLEDYNRDENRYNAGRGAHLTLKRAEKARAAICKLPAIVEALVSKIRAWEKDRGIKFTYDGVWLLSMLEEYSILKEEKEQEHRKQRDQKKLQGQLMAEQEALFGSKPSPSKPHSAKKNPRTSVGSAKFDLLHSTISGPGSTVAAGASRQTRKGNRSQQDAGFGALSTGLRVEKHAFNSANAREIEAPVGRKPFSPVSAMFSKANSTNFLEDLNRVHNGSSPKMLVGYNTPSTTPSMVNSVTDDENRTPKSMPIPVPATPCTVSIPMQTAMTPASAPVPICVLLESAVAEMPEKIEYSFEERRAGFVIHKLQPNPVHV